MEALFAPDSFSGWGIRSLAASESRYNPMGYHNGGVWPHDNALIAWGLSRYGMTFGISPNCLGESLAASRRNTLGHIAQAPARP
jgi:glycogen debranching enzyme